MKQTNRFHSSHLVLIHDEVEVVRLLPKIPLDTVQVQVDVDLAVAEALVHDGDLGLELGKIGNDVLTNLCVCGASIITRANACDYERQRCILIQI